MALMIDGIPEDKAEAYVYKSIEKNLPSDIICYHNRCVHNREFDFCILIKGMGVLIIEVKGWLASQIIKVPSHGKIYVTFSDDPLKSPKSQARGYRFELHNLLKDNYHVDLLVMEAVCYPNMTEDEYKHTPLLSDSEPEYTFFKGDLDSKAAFSKKITKIYNSLKSAKHDTMNKKMIDICRAHFEAASVDSCDETEDYSRLSIFPDGITIGNINSLLQSYFEGVKQCVFVNAQEEIRSIANNAEQLFQQNGVKPDGQNLKLDPDGEARVISNSNSLRLFNLEVYAVDDLKQICNNERIIHNGQYSNADLSILQQLSEKSGFNIEQYMVEHAPVDKNIQVRAGAGTGKTFSMIARIAYICHAASGAKIKKPENEIAMLTFTTDAASNMKNRLKALYMNYFALTGNAEYLTRVIGIEQMRVSTIHSFANDIVKNTTLPLGIGTDFATVSGNYNRQVIFNNCMNEYLAKKTQEEPGFLMDAPFSIYDFKKYLLEFSEMLYRKGCDIKFASQESFGKPIESMPYISEIIQDVLRQTEVKYAEYLYENNAISLSEYMFYLNRCIDDESFNAELYPFKYLFVDEFQDVDDTQIAAFLSMQKKLRYKMFIVGDLKQSIYRFRGATMDAFSHMGCDNDSWSTFTLNTNYRSDSRLLNQYDYLFTQMGAKSQIPYDADDDLLRGVKTGDLPDDELTAHYGYTEDDETTGAFFDKLFDVVNQRKTQLENLAKEKSLSSAEKTVAILTRTNRQISIILKEAKKRGVLVESDTNGDLYRLQSTLDLCKLTAALCNPYDPNYLYALLMSNNVNIEFPVNYLAGTSSAQKAEVLVDCLNQYYQQTLHIGWSELIAQVQSQPVLMVLRKIYEATAPWKSYSASKERQDYYRSNYDLVFEQLAKWNRKRYLTLESINETLHLLISTGTEQKSREPESDNDYVKVVCTTVHKSKGLEYDTVVLPYTNKRIDDLQRNGLEITYVDGKVGYCFSINGNAEANEYFYTDNEKIELMREESRILYVALTRAINKFIWFHKEGNRNYNWANILEDLICQ